MLTESTNRKYINIVQVEDKRGAYGTGRMFAERTRDGENWVFSTPLPNLSGAELRNITVGMGKQKVPKQQVMLDMRFANGEDYQLGCNFNGVTRALMNSLLSLTPEMIEKGMRLDLGLYTSSKTGNPGITVNVDGERLEWKYSIEDQPDAEPYQDPADGSTKYNQTVKNKFFWDRVEKDLSPLFANQSKVGKIYDGKPVEPSESGIPDTVMVPPSNDDDLPF